MERVDGHRPTLLVQLSNADKHRGMHTIERQHLVGFVPEVIGHDTQVRAFPRLDLVVIVPDEL
jgi:hypothetical protein